MTAHSRGYSTVNKLAKHASDTVHEMILTQIWWGQLTAKAGFHVSNMRQLQDFCTQCLLIPSGFMKNDLNSSSPQHIRTLVVQGL